MFFFVVVILAYYSRRILNEISDFLKQKLYSYNFGLFVCEFITIFLYYPDSDQRFLEWIRIRPNDTDPTKHWFSIQSSKCGPFEFFLQPFLKIKIPGLGSRSRLKKQLIYLFYIFFVVLLVCGEKNILPNSTNSQEPEPFFGNWEFLFTLP